MKGNSIFKSDGIVLLNKSRGISSFKAINKLKWIIGSSKVGHAGTLDPIAEGLLIVMINNATKFSDNLMKRDKEYFVELELGYETDTYDTEGEITEKYEGNIDISNKEIIEVINSFTGEIMQVPPMYSAIKINGEKLYELARKGIEVEREARKVKIYSIREINVESKEKCKISFYTEVSSGTYIRSLVRDIGRKLGVYATMTRLVRTKIDKYNIEGQYVQILDAHAAYLNATPASKVVVEGNTDERGTPEYNIALGQRRADAVKSFLAGKGVEGSKVSTVSYGEEKPAVLGHDEAAYSKNRRAVLAY